MKVICFYIVIHAYPLSFGKSSTSPVFFFNFPLAYKYRKYVENNPVTFNDDVTNYVTNRTASPIVVE
jgi:hypothetical protein